jgi:hypothetical protein
MLFPRIEEAASRVGPPSGVVMVSSVEPADGECNAVHGEGPMEGLKRKDHHCGGAWRPRY